MQQEAKDAPARKGKASTRPPRPPFFSFKGFSFVEACNVPPATRKPTTRKEKRRNMEITPPQRPKMNDKIKIIPPESLKTLRRLPIVSLFGGQSPDPPYLLKAAGVGILPRGDIQTLIGQAKSGKSTAARALIIALLRGEFGNVQAAQKHARAAVLLADTEQAEHNAVANAREILRAAGLDEQEENEVLRLICLRACEYRSRLAVIEDEIKAFRPDFVLIDGVADLVKSVNEEEQSGEVIQNLMRITAENNCAALIVLHVNKRADDEGKDIARGHLGALCEAKSSEVYNVTRDPKKDIVTITATKCRNETPPPIRLRVGRDDTGTPKIYPVSERECNESERIELQDLFADVFAERESLNAGELQERIMKYTGKAVVSAKKLIARAVHVSLLKREKQGRASLYYLTAPPLADTTQTPPHAERLTAESTAKTQIVDN